MSFRRITVLTLLVLLIGAGTALAQGAPQVTISRVAGTVEVSHPKATSGKWQAAKKDQKIGSGWKLRTGDDGKVQLTFPQNNTAVLKSNSVLFIDKLDAGGGGNVKSDKGGFLFDLKNALSPGSKFEVDTPSALATVRGTQFGVLLGKTPTPAGPIPIPYPSVFEDGSFEQLADQQDSDGDGIADYIDDDDDGDGVPDEDESNTEQGRVWDSRSQVWQALKRAGAGDTDSEGTTLHGYEGTVEVENEHGNSSLTEGTTVEAVDPDQPPSNPQPSGPDAQQFQKELKEYFETGDKPTQDQIADPDDQEFGDAGDFSEFSSELAAINEQLDEIEQELGSAEDVDLAGILIGLLLPAVQGLSEQMESADGRYVLRAGVPLRYMKPTGWGLNPTSEAAQAFVEQLAAYGDGSVMPQDAVNLEQILIGLSQEFVDTYDRFEEIDGQLSDAAEVIVRGWDPVKKEAIQGLAREFERISGEWDRYERNDQDTQLLFLYKQILDLHEELHGLIEGFDSSHRLTRGSSYAPDEIEQLMAAMLELADGDQAPGEIDLPQLDESLLPALDDLVPAVQALLDELAATDALIMDLHGRMEYMRDEIEPLISDNEDLQELLRGLIDPGDPVLGLRFENMDTDNDGLSDVAEVALGLDPLLSNDEGFIVLVAPDDGETFQFPEDSEIQFEFEEMDTDAIEEYTLVLEAGGRRFTRADARGFEDVELEQLVGPGGAFSEAVQDDGTLMVEWHVTARLEDGVLANPASSPALRMGLLESERRSFTIELPVQEDVIIIDLDSDTASPAVGDTVIVRGSISEINMLGDWEIRVAYDPSVLQFDQGRKLGLFNASTVFFGEQPGGVVVISGAAPRGSGGISGEGDIFLLEFTALEPEDTVVEGDDVLLHDTLDTELDADFGSEADIEIEESRQGAGRFDNEDKLFR